MLRAGATSPPSPGRGLLARVLIVEDEPSIGFILREVLEGEGHKVTVLTSGTAALDWLAVEPPPDAVLLDLLMPGLGGREVLEAIRRERRLREVPVILVTGAVPKGDGFPAEGSYQGLLTKPFDLADVVSVVNSAVGRDGG